MEWQFIVALLISLLIMLFVPKLVTSAVASGLYQVARDRLRKRATAPRRKAVKVAEEAGTR